MEIIIVCWIQPLGVGVVDKIPSAIGVLMLEPGFRLVQRFLARPEMNPKWGLATGGGTRQKEVHLNGFRDKGSDSR